MNFSKLIADINASKPGPETAAIFDFDGTIIAGFSATVFLQDALTRGELKPDELYELTRALTGFGLGNMGFSALMAVHAQYLAGRDEDEYTRNSERLFRKKIARLIYPEARELIAAHQAKGHSVAIISSATPYQVLPAARDLNIDRVFCTGLEVENGCFTGAVVKPTCFGEGKVDAAQTLARDTGADLSQSFFYSDSVDDIQLLEYVGRPVTLNPRKRLKQITKENNWPTTTFDSRGRLSVNRFLRSVAATGSLVGSVAAALPLYALTGSKRDSLNFSISLFADTCSALIGLNLEVTGEEHLWAQRPAVFMFNHQSKADVAVMARLVRRDVVAVGKKEIQRMPLIGQAMGAAGVVFIDRSDRSKAIESMAPLATAMREEGQSLVIAPEGTRAPTRKLAPFKKGGFHMAMQVGVPIVPVVIHNAGDIAPKGDFVFKPGTVRVDVLPPVDTTGWSLEKMDEQVTLVRNMFLQALGQPEQTVAQTLEEQKALPEDMRPEKAGKATKKPRKAKAAAKKKLLSKRPKTTDTTTKVVSKGRQVAGKATTQAKTKVAKASTSAAKPSSQAKAKPKSAASPAGASKGRQVAGKATTKAKTKVTKASTSAAKPSSKAKAKAKVAKAPTSAAKPNSKAKPKVTKAPTSAAKPASAAKAKAKTNGKSKAPAKSVGAKKAMTRNSRTDNKPRGASVKPKLASTR
ncbi:HAD-IB family hydrolase [Luminiphilus sp. nBUS_07]|uniref:HAD-IB family hydrolase n=1 Tax=Luminiphilus sp. nBUS_07 TaxID=3395314 RepID=UPI003EB961D9